MKKKNIVLVFLCITFIYWAIVILSPIAFSLLDYILPKRYQRGSFIPAAACWVAYAVVESFFDGEHPVIVIFNSIINLLTRFISLYVWIQEGVRSQIISSIFCIVVILIFIFIEAKKFMKNPR